MDNEIQIFDSLEINAFNYLENYYINQNRSSYWKHVEVFKNFLFDNNYSLRFIHFVDYYNHLDTLWRNAKIKSTTFNCWLCASKSSIKFLAKSSFSKDIVKRFHLKEMLDDYKTKKGGSKFISKDKYLTSAEIKKVVNECSNKTVSLMLDFLYKTSLRISEVTNIRLSRIEKRISEKGIPYYDITLPLKGNKEGHTIVSTGLIDNIKKHFKSEEYLFEHLYNGERRKFSSVCMTNKIEEQIKLVLGKSKKRAHSIRHSSLNALYEKTKDLKKVSMRAHHSSSAITADLYLHGEFSYDELNEIYEDF